MKVLYNWEETLEYVNRLGLVNRSMPIGWKQQVLMDNVVRIETISAYPLIVQYNRKMDWFSIPDYYSVKASHN